MPANRIVHAFKRLRPKQVRGIPMLAVVTDKFFQLDELMDAEIISTKIAACFSVFIESPDGTTSPLFKDGEKVIAKVYLSPDSAVLRIVLPELTQQEQLKIDVEHHLVDFRRKP